MDTAVSATNIADARTCIDVFMNMVTNPETDRRRPDIPPAPRDGDVAVAVIDTVGTWDGDEGVPLTAYVRWQTITAGESCLLTLYGAPREVFDTDATVRQALPRDVDIPWTRADCYQSQHRI
jgi:hypothetical protein